MSHKFEAYPTHPRRGHVDLENPLSKELVVALNLTDYANSGLIGGSNSTYIIPNLANHPRRNGVITDISNNYWNWDVGAGGQGAHNTTGGVARINLGPSDELIGTDGNFTGLLLFAKTDATNRQSAPFGIVAGSAANRVGGHCPWSDGIVYWDYGGQSGNNRLTHNFEVWTVNEPKLWIFTMGPRGSEIWRDGERVAFRGIQVTRTATTQQYAMGATASYRSDRAIYHTHQVWNRQLAFPEIATLSRDPYVLFRPAVQRTFFVPTAAPSARNRAMVVS